MREYKKGSYKILTYGCQSNERDSETIAGLLESQGYVPVQDIDKADVVILNTCCVRHTAENKVFGKLGELKHLKQQNPEMLVVICGCMSQQKDFIQKIGRRSFVLDVVMGTHNLHRLPKLLEQAKNTDKTVIEVWEREGEIVENLPVRRVNRTRALINIMYGCNNFCTYCIVPYVRGRERSREFTSILEEVKTAISEGYQEIMLLGQNVNSYGQDRDDGMDFADLLTELDQVPGIERIRYMTSHPKDFSEKIIRAIADSKHVCEHFHLPIQAGSNSVLKWMNRRYTREQYMKTIERIRELFTNYSITTDIIVGFPQETESCFNETLDLVKWAQFDSVFSFVYSPRIGTPAAKMPDSIPLEIKKERLKRLMDLQNQISEDINRKLVGKSVEVLVEGPSKTNATKLTGRTRTNKIVIFDGPLELTGKLVEVEITEGRAIDLKGTLVSQDNLEKQRALI